MTDADRFRARSGEWRVTDSHLELRRSRPRSPLAQLATLGGRVGPTVWLAVIGVAIAASGVRWLLADAVEGLFDLALAALLLGGAWLGRHDSGADAVPRAQIERVEAHAPQGAAGRAFFVVWFRDGARLRRRYILLPGDEAGGLDAFAEACAVLTRAGLLPAG